MLVQSRVPQKSFLFLLEEKEIARQIKKCEENFFAEQRAKRAAAGRFIRDFAQNESELFGIMTTKQKFRLLNRNFCLLKFLGAEGIPSELPKGFIKFPSTYFLFDVHPIWNLLSLRLLRT